MLLHSVYRLGLKKITLKETVWESLPFLSIWYVPALFWAMRDWLTSQRFFLRSDLTVICCCVVLLWVVGKNIWIMKQISLVGQYQVSPPQDCNGPFIPLGSCILDSKYEWAATTIFVDRANMFVSGNHIEGIQKEKKPISFYSPCFRCLDCC